MRIVKFSDNNVIIHDGRRKWNISIDVGNYEYSHVDYSEGVIRIREDSPDIYLEILHEIHHLYTPLLEPIWYPLVKGDVDLFSDDIVKAFRRLAQRSNNPFIKAGYLVVRYGRPDNYIEDLNIREHFVKRHRIPLRRIDAIETDVKQTRRLLKALRPLVKEDIKIATVSIGYTLLDFFYCVSNGISLKDYYREAVRYLSNATIPGTGIFRKAMDKRISLELRRVTYLKNLFEDERIITSQEIDFLVREFFELR